MRLCFLAFVFLVVCVFSFCPVRRNEKAVNTNCLAPAMGNVLDLSPSEIIPLNVHSPKQRFVINVKRFAEQAETTGSINPDLLFDIMETIRRLGDYELKIGVNTLIQTYGKEETAYALFCMWDFYAGAGKEVVSELDRFGMAYFDLLKRDPLIEIFFEKINSVESHLQVEAVAFLTEHFKQNAHMFSVMFFYRYYFQDPGANSFSYDPVFRLNFFVNAFPEVACFLEAAENLVPDKYDEIAWILEKMANIVTPFSVILDEVKVFYDGTERYLNEFEDSLNHNIKGVKGIFLLSGAKTMMETTREYAHHKGWTDKRFDEQFKAVGINMRILDYQRDYKQVDNEAKELALRYLDQIGVLDVGTLYVYDSGFKGTLVRFIQDLVADKELVKRVLDGKNLEDLKVVGRLISYTSYKPVVDNYFWDNEDVIEKYRDISGFNYSFSGVSATAQKLALLTDDDISVAFGTIKEQWKYSPQSLFEKKDKTVEVKFKGSEMFCFNTLRKQFLKIARKHWNEKDLSASLDSAA